MSTIRILLGLLWLAVIGSGWGAGSGAVKQYSTAYRLIEIAGKEIGVTETTKNSSPQIDKYNAYVGFKAVPWCASFVAYCFGKAGFNKPRTAWSPALFPVGRLVQSPAAGMVLGIYYPALKRIAHCGLVESVKGNYVFSIEGNTNVNGAREGNGVYRKVRHIRTIHRYADWLTDN